MSKIKRNPITGDLETKEDYYLSNRKPMKPEIIKKTKAQLALEKKNAEFNKLTKAEKRMVAICQNLIKNNGTFKP